MLVRFVPASPLPLWLVPDACAPLSPQIKIPGPLPGTGSAACDGREHWFAAEEHIAAHAGPQRDPDRSSRVAAQRRDHLAQALDNSQQVGNHRGAAGARGHAPGVAGRPRAVLVLFRRWLVGGPSGWCVAGRGHDSMGSGAPQRRPVSN